jgi:hypothetical protein
VNNETAPNPRYLGPDQTPSQRPPTRADLAVDAALRRGHGGYVTDEEITAAAEVEA